MKKKKCDNSNKQILGHSNKLELYYSGSGML